MKVKKRKTEVLLQWNGMQNGSNHRRTQGMSAPLFPKNIFFLEKPIKTARLFITALGTYEVVLNGSRVGEFVLAPGWTSYEKRLQYQAYDITNLLGKDNHISVTVGKRLVPQSYARLE